MKFISPKTIALIRDTKESLWQYSKRIIDGRTMRDAIDLAVERFYQQTDFLEELK